MTKTFLEIFFTQIILQSQGNLRTSREARPLVGYIYKLEDNITLAKGVDWYLKKGNIEKASLTSVDEKALVKWGVEILRKGVAEILRGQLE
jgi:hypothetical protein